MIRRPPRSTRVRSSAASDVYKRQPRRADLVLASVELADRGRVVVDRHRLPLEVVLDPVAQLHDLGPLLEERQDGDLVRRKVRVDSQDHALLAPDLAPYKV